MKKSLLFLLSLAFIFQGCFNEPEEKKFEPIANTLYIANEGNFQWGNGSLSLFDTLTQKITSNTAFMDANGIPLGDVFQSMHLEGDLLYLVVNNSGKIHAVNKKSLVLKKTYSGFGSPRYLSTYNYDKALVTDIYSNQLNILNLSSGAIDKKIPLIGWSERMLLDGNAIYISNLSNSNLFVFDTDKEIIADSIHIGYAALRVLKDKNQRLWVLSKGNPANQIEAQLSLLSVDRKNVEQSWKLPFTDLRDMVYDENTDDFYLLDKDLYRFSKNVGLSNTPLISANGKNYYACYMLNSKLYLADAKDYVQAGTLEIYYVNGTYIKSFDLGPIPNGFIFDK